MTTNDVKTAAFLTKAELAKLLQAHGLGNGTVDSLNGRLKRGTVPPPDQDGVRPLVWSKARIEAWLAGNRHSDPWTAPPFKSSQGRAA